MDGLHRIFNTVDRWEPATVILQSQSIETGWFRIEAEALKTKVVAEPGDDSENVTNSGADAVIGFGLHSDTAFSSRSDVATTSSVPTASSSHSDVATTSSTKVVIASSSCLDGATTSYTEVAAVSSISDTESDQLVTSDFDLEFVDESSFGVSITGSALAAENKVHFHYTKRVDPIRLLFTARTAKGEDIIIKFGYGRYGLEAHTKAAAANLAPAVLGFSWIPGGWWMVAMELLDKGFEPCSKSNVNKHCRSVIISSISAFHALGFVHGDLRASNVLVRKHGEQWECKLIDFDWAGLAGKVTYPFGVYCTNKMYRPMKYMDQLPITVRDDQLTVDNMLAECKR
ncbi:hypothetical protein D9757_006634 [Collybiopsis confluens]|uniref:Uncharacterized protein n=1 Tax=Collybiopsis confluens TaxID=2823264 RepID=A0A8H5HNM6_9AGAR|nr:hypothetical protein D9757_006634 [Collybiopsis confluens]